MPNNDDTTKTRKSLIAPLADTKPLSPLSVDDTERGTRELGLPSRTIEPAHIGAIQEPISILGRKRKKVGRTHQLNVRLKPETAAQIYDIANERNIPVAQVIEEALSVFRQIPAPFSE